MNQKINDTMPASESTTDGGNGHSPEDQSTTATAAPVASHSIFDGLKRLFRARNGSSLRDDLADALSNGHTDSASFSPSERAMLHNILRLKETRVEDVMVPRADIEALEETTSLGELLDVFEKSGHSRMPVYSETLDGPRGMIHIRDVVAYLTRISRKKKRSRGGPKQPSASSAAPSFNFAEVDLSKPIGELNIMRPVLFVPPSMFASDLMSKMQATRTQMALVIDEYGGTDGLVSLEDLVELVVGDIEDEHDDEEALVTQAADGVFIVDAKAEIDDVAELIGSSFNGGEYSEDVDTIGGLIFNALGRIPARGEVVQAIPGFEFHIVEADPRRIKRVRIVQGRAGDRRRRIARQQTE